jgi:hypothetical protein
MTDSDSSSDGLMDAYAFVEQTSGTAAEFVDAVVKVPGVRFAARTVGSVVAVVAVECDGLGQLQDDLLPQVAKAGSVTSGWTAAAGPRPTGLAPKKGKTRHGGLVRLRTSDRVATAVAVLDRLGHLDDPEWRDQGFGLAVAHTYGGGFDVLLDIGAPTADDVFDLLSRLDALPSVAAADIALARYDDNARWLDS